MTQDLGNIGDPVAILETWRTRFDYVQKDRLAAYELAEKLREQVAQLEHERNLARWDAAKKEVELVELRWEVRNLREEAAADQKRADHWAAEAEALQAELNAHVSGYYSQFREDVA